jgi:hypothetical protein
MLMRLAMNPSALSTVMRYVCVCIPRAPENCEKDRKDVAVAWCFECYGFFCAADDDKIHAIGIFRHHQRDYDAQSFATYTAQVRICRVPRSQQQSSATPDHCQYLDIC